MKEQLLEIFNAMKTIETHGDSTVTMADCLRALANIINSIPIEEKKDEQISEV